MKYPIKIIFYLSSIKKNHINLWITSGYNKISTYYFPYSNKLFAACKNYNIKV